MDRLEAQLEHLEAGGVLQCDFRTEVNKNKKLRKNFYVVQWNIERGVQYEKIMETLFILRETTDIILLQEVDVGCRRSAYRNVFLDLARTLQMYAVFFCEFEELGDPSRKEAHAVSPQCAMGSTPQSSQSGLPTPPRRHFHGNMILSKCVPLRDPVVLFHSVQPVDWERDGGSPKYREPRHGRRGALRVLVSPVDREAEKGEIVPPLFLYNCHLEVFCGGLDRVRQLGDCILDAQRLTQRVRQETAGLYPAFIIAGDLNTMAHGIVRFSDKYGTDRLKLLSLGETEACWLQRKVLNSGMSTVVKGCCPFSYRFPFYVLSNVYELLFNNSVAWWLVLGFPLRSIIALKSAVRQLCFYDTGDKYHSITLSNPDYYNLVQGKLDWVLLSNLKGKETPVTEENRQALEALIQVKSITNPRTVRAVQTGGSMRDGYLLFNDDYTASDHKGLLLSAEQFSGPPEECYPPYGPLYSHSMMPYISWIVSRAIPVLLVTTAVKKWWQ